MFGCLSVCATAARGIAAANGLPLVGVHHMQAHALTPLLTETTPPQFPFLTLLVSGGHTQLVLAESWDTFRILMGTIDNAIG
jgi:N6-L-threonylcarbamoyladenine synthase